MKQTISILILFASLSVNAQSDISSKFSLSNNNAPEAPQALLSCAGYDAYQQPLDDANFANANTSDAEFSRTVHESMVDGTGAITPMINGSSNGMKIWGLSLEFDPNLGFVGSCVEDYTALTPFNITFSDNNAGQPGNVIASVTATVDNVTETGVPFAFTTIQEINLSYPETDMTNVSWVSIQRQQGQNATNGNACTFLWLDETAVSYDDSALADDGVTLTPLIADQTMCLNEYVYVPPQPVPSLRWYSMIALLLAIGFFSTRLFLKARN